MASEHLTHEETIQGAISHWLALNESVFTMLMHHPDTPLMQNTQSLPGIFASSLERFAGASSALVNNAWTVHRDRLNIPSAGRSLDNAYAFSADVMNELCQQSLNKIRGSGKAYQALCGELSKARDANDIGLALADCASKTQALDRQSAGQLSLLFAGIGPALRRLVQDSIGDLRCGTTQGGASQT